MRFWPLLCFFVLGAVACAESVPPLTFDIRVVDVDGEDPFAGGEFDRVRIRVQQEGSEIVNLEAATGETFDLSTPFESLSAPTRVRLELEGPEPLHGAPPAFAPGATQGALNFAVGVPASCERVAGFERNSATGASYARIDTFVLGAGGDESDSVWVFDLLYLGITELEPLPAAGPTTSAPLGTSSALIVGNAGAYRYDLAVDPSREERVRELTLHADADATTQLLTRRNGGVLAVGPGQGFSLVAPDGLVVRGEMDMDRDGPALVEFGGQLLIIGGNTDGALVEVVDADRGTTSPMVEGVTLPASQAIIVDDAIWLIHADGTSSVLHGCPACTVMVGDPVQATRVGGAHLAGDTMLWRAAAGPGFEPVATLAAPSRALFAYESGIVFVADAEGAQLCFPEALTPL